MFRCAAKCADALHTSRVGRPRQHWDLAIAPSPTTRPPRKRSLWTVRVVGLGAQKWMSLAGAAIELLDLLAVVMQIGLGIKDEKRCWEWQQ